MERMRRTATEPGVATIEVAGIGFCIRLRFVRIGIDTCRWWLVTTHTILSGASESAAAQSDFSGQAF